VNREFHNGEPVRTEKSIGYVIGKLINDEVWKNNLEEQWLSNIK
jgi:hypothetical protein